MLLITVMMATDSDRLITLAIHTYERAVPIKNLLEREGIKVELNNVNLSSPVVSSGVRLRIKESDLPLALRIVENIDIFSPDGVSDKETGGVMLVPTDFSAHSLKAALLAMVLAARQKRDIEFLYAFIPPSNRDTVQLSDAYEYELADIAATRQMQKDADALMARFTETVREAIKAGKVPAVKFTSRVTEGIPEEAILEYAREEKPEMIVMGTREANKKEAELIGSVTAEVLDSCRIPAFTVPENVDMNLFTDLQQVAFFCNLDQNDLLAMDALYRMFPDFNLNVTLIDIPSRTLRPGAPDKARNNLLAYCHHHYEGYTFTQRTIDPKNMLSEFEAAEKDDRYQLICMPNKRKNAIARMFNPSLAHRILFRADIPMMVIPV